MTERKQPKYVTIAADLEAAIKAGWYHVGQALPGQRELSAQYGVTLMTLRQALRLLEERGIITQHAGRGTFVKSPKPTYGMATLRSLSDELRAQGHEVQTDLLGKSRRPAPQWVAEQLNTTDPVLRIERLRKIDGTPAIHQVSWVPEPYLKKPDFTSLYSALEVPVVRATERLTPAVLSERLATLLDQPPGVPVFLSDRLTFGPDDVPVVFDRATIVGIEIRTDRKAEDAVTLPAWRRSPTVQ
ncbi:GntR family transcriptional regulator [Lentzea sp. NBRC 105346]|nr:GntR family transcriptional regulator [Lentzea sp. NBRC 105346]